MFDPTWFIEGGEVTSSFGWRVRNGKKKFHEGVDIAPPNPDVDVNVRSPISGRIVEPWDTPWGTVTLRDDFSYLHQFLHSKAILVRVGADITPRTVVGLMGAKGVGKEYEDGKVKAHLHYQIREPNGKLINPQTDYCWAAQTEMQKFLVWLGDLTPEQVCVRVPESDYCSDALTMKDLLGEIRRMTPDQAAAHFRDAIARRKAWSHGSTLVQPAARADA